MRKVKAWDRFPRLLTFLLIGMSPSNRSVWLPLLRAVIRALDQPFQSLNPGFTFKPWKLTYKPVEMLLSNRLCLAILPLGYQFPKVIVAPM